MPRRPLAIARLPFALLALPLLLAAALACGEGRDERPVRLIVVTLDTLRYDGLVPADGAPSPMPGLLARAREQGLLFERFYAATSVTQPSHASMFTALHPWEHGVVSNGQILESHFTTVAERLQEAGFATGGVVASFPVAGRFGFAQGFDEFHDLFVEQPVAWRRWEGHEVPQATFYSLARTVTDDALALLDRLEARVRPEAAAGGEAPGLLLWVHYFDAHDPYGDADGEDAISVFETFQALEEGRDAAPYLARSRAAYDEDLRVLDAQLERLFARLEEDAESYRTHVVLASDHGESFGEAGAIAHGKRLTEEQIRVPLVILSPDLEPAVRGDVAGSVDVAPTLLALAGQPIDDAPWSKARDLTDPGAAAAAAEAERRGLRGGAFGMRRTFERRDRIERRADGTRVRLPRYLFYTVDAAGRTYRGNSDGFLPGHEPASERLRQQVLTAFAAFHRQAEEGVAPSAGDPETLEALRALGYVD